MRSGPRSKRSPPQARPIAWATKVNGVSSQYGDPSWAAHQVLGPPNVFPKHGDIPQAWASAAPDTGTEWIEVGFARPSPIAAVVVYETFNPGAIVGVTLLTEDGESVAAPMDRAVAETSPEGSVHRRFELACTTGRVWAVRLELDSLRVPVERDRRDRRRALRSVAISSPKLCDPHHAVMEGSCSTVTSPAFMDALVGSASRSCNSRRI
jgi:hypothetical protein